MLESGTGPSVESPPAGLPEPNQRGLAGVSAQPGPMGRNSHPDRSGLTFSTALFSFSFSSSFFFVTETHF